MNPFDEFDEAPVQPLVAPGSLAPRTVVVGPGDPLRVNADQRADRAEARVTETVEDQRRRNAEADRREERRLAIAEQAARSGKPLRQGDGDDLEAQVNLFAGLKSSLSGFQDDYAGNSVIGRAENWAQGLNNDIGTPGQRAFWSAFDAVDMQIRNKMFGASLTDSEKASYDAVTVTPSMDPKIVRENIAKRMEIVQKALQRKVGRLRARYDKTEVDAALGEYAPDLLPKTAIATGDTKTEYNAKYTQELAGRIRRGESAETINAWLKTVHGNPVDDATIKAAQTFLKSNRDYKKPIAEVTTTTPTTATEKAAATWSTIGAGISGAANAATMGTTDEIVGAITALGGGDYTQARDEFDQKKRALAAERPVADVVGNIAGGVGTALTGAAAVTRFAPGLAGRVAGALGPAARYGQTADDVARIGANRAAMVSDLGYGAAYGAGQENDNRWLGAGKGAVAGAIGGAAGRGLTRGTANVISPPAGDMGATYARGAFPTLGQRFGRSGFIGRALNNTEQAMQSVPGLGALVYRARQRPSQDYQIGGFNDALGDIGQRLPEGTAPGTVPHALASGAFNEVYSAARQGMQFTPDPQYLADLAQFQQRLGNGVLNAEQARQVGAVIQNSVGTRLPRGGGIMGGESYQRAGTEIGDAIDTWSRDPTSAPMAQAARDYVTIFDNAARRNSDPAAVQMLDQADTGYAKLVRIQDASKRVGGDAGTFTPTGLDRSVQQNAGGVRSGPYLRGEALMQEYADAGRGLVDTLPNSGTADRLFAGQAVVGGAGAMLGVPGMLAANPGALAPFALYAPGINHAVTRAIAPRSATLSPGLAAVLESIGTQVNNRAPAVGRVAAPGALAWQFNQ